MVVGGQLTTTSDVENYPGYADGVSGMAMMDDLRRQALRFDADIRSGVVTEVKLDKYPFEVTIDGESKLEAESIIIATGAQARYLGLPSEERYKGLGVSACAVCDGFFYRKKDVAVVGGGDTACEDALYMAGLSDSVKLIVRKPYLRASKVLQQRVKDNPKIEILFEHQIREIIGDDAGVTGIMVENTSTQTMRQIDLSGVFMAIGQHPATELFSGQIELDEEGYIKLKGRSSHTNIEGVFAAGDVCSPQYRQAVVAAGNGCVAALDCERWLMTR
jgi:thioredoxin reductase (NADPH)